MINVLIRTRSSVVVYILADGHARGVGCVNVVCASFSFLLRTFLGVLDFEGEDFVVDNALRGYLEFRPSFRDLSKKGLFYYSRFLIRGIRDLCFEYPCDIKLILEEIDGNE
ncbi:ribosomal-processing cysteine protease Prp [Borrelia sp. P9F1]|uniref:ribosomal-processing cysteine protease Prp n=1 Tax=Borrelia sp. P9F1 TaxID=3058374 RepID=UPI002646FF64|nr:ribosomal-processing cysteine protease Prp [Borrelia sp. P9F1]WKC58311.1 ribosomal-processing cysteine protease Prp [Borrelia sp. P9F1]